MPLARALGLEEIRVLYLAGWWPKASILEPAAVQIIHYTQGNGTYSI